MPSATVWRWPRRRRARVRSPWDHPLYLGGIGVTGSTAANTLARQADVILAVGTRLQDFTTGSHALFNNARLIQLNVSAADANKNNAQALVADAQAGLSALSRALGDWRAPSAWQGRAREEAAEWRKTVDKVTAAPRGNTLPSDAQVLGAVNRRTSPDDIVVCAAGGLAGRAAQAVAGHRARAAIIWNMAIPAWVTRLPAASG